MRMRIGFSTRLTCFSGPADNGSRDTLNRSANFLARSESICDRNTLVDPSPTTGASTGAGSSTTGVATVAFPALGPATADFPENESRLDPSPLFNTVFTLVRNLLTPFFFSSGASFAGALIIAAERRGCNNSQRRDWVILTKRLISFPPG